MPPIGQSQMKVRFRWVGCGVVLIILVSLAVWGWVPSSASGANCRLTGNGAWISVDWTSLPVDETKVAELAEHATARDLHYLFPYTTYVKSDGTFSPSYDHAAEFVSRFRQHNQETRLLAWVGIPLENDRKLGIQGWVDLSDEGERQTIVAFVETLVDEADFDGVHLNVETVRDGDRSYLLLLEEVRDAIGPGRILSVAGSYWLPKALNELPFAEGFKWSGEYYGAVANQVDQIATMTYDSLMLHPVLYRLWLREQVRGIGRSLADSEVELLIGISVSRERTMTHRPNAENMQSGLVGTCAGFHSAGCKAGGIAVYAAWEAEEVDWRIWETWLAGED